MRSDLEEGQQGAQIGEGGAGAMRSGCREAPGRQGGPGQAGRGEPQTLYGVTGGQGATREGCMEELPCLPST